MKYRKLKITRHAKYDYIHPMGFSIKTVHRMLRAATEEKKTLEMIIHKCERWGNAVDDEIMFTTYRFKNYRFTIKDLPNNNKLLISITKL